MRLLKSFTLVFLFFLLSGSLFGGTLVQVRVAHANARVEPDSGAEITAVLNRGQTLPVVEDVPYWYGVTLSDGQTAYVAKSLCRVVLAEEGENTEEETGQPLGELYSLPPAGAPVAIPDCTTTTVSADFTICPLGGTPGGSHTTANAQKNRLERPCSFSAMTVDQVLKLKGLPSEVRALPSGDQRKVYLQTLESRAVVLEGFAAMVKNGGQESVNCDSSTRLDIHMEVVGMDAVDPRSNRDTHVVTEVTPWFRQTITSWTTSTLGQFASYRGGYSGTMHGPPGRIRVYGWLFYDNPHAGDGSVGTWRGTAWEVHPITRIEVFETGQWRSVE